MRVYRATLGTAEKMGPPPDPNTPEPAPDVQQQLADIWDSVFKIQEAAASPAAPAAAAPTTADWITAHQAAILAAGAGLFALALFATMRRP